MQIEETKIKVNNLNNVNENLNHKDDLRLYNNLFQLENINLTMWERIDYGIILQKNKIWVY